MSTPTRVDVYDTTLRDGTQGEGFNLSLQDKLAIARKLDEFGVDFIEGGFPLSNPKDEAFFREIRDAKLKHAKISAFGMTRRRGMAAKDDPGMQALLNAQTPAITIVGKTSDFQVREVMNVSPDENLAMIRESVSLMREAGRIVIYDAEHFFDTFRSNKEYALSTLLAAQDAGAAILCLCDTNGGSMPEFIEQAVAEVKKKTSVVIGIHTHNDSGLALANAQAAIKAGATHAQGTINGVGERCGNMDLLPLVANLKLKLGYECMQPSSMERLTEISRFVFDTANMNHLSGQPYVGASAFAHKGGMHVHAVQKFSSTYEHVPPESVGNTRKILVSELSGVSNIAAQTGKRFKLENDKETLRAVLAKVQDMENAGYQFESAEGSFELLVRKQIGKHKSFFDLQHYRVTVLRQDAHPVAEATIKLKIGSTEEHRVAEGDGPVAALDAALRKALRPSYPQIDEVHLVDYKVRVINSKDETSAAVRVVIESKRAKKNGSKEIFGTIGVSQNIIDASWQALVDAYEYHLLHSEEEAAGA